MELSVNKIDNANAEISAKIEAKEVEANVEKGMTFSALDWA